MMDLRPLWLILVYILFLYSTCVMNGDRGIYLY
jgi:hypothetical protein